MKYINMDFFSKRAGSLVVATAIAAVSAHAAAVTTTTVQRFSDRSTVDGASSTLIRNEAGVTMAIITSDLTPGDAFTNWWVIFNNPAACATPGSCAGSDLAPRGGDPAVQSSVLYATGQVISTTGAAGFAARLEAGDTDGALFGPGLLNPMTAEIHHVVRTHGQPIPGMTEAQIDSFSGGCPPNDCIDEQFAVHLPGTDVVSEALKAIRALEIRIARALSIRVED